MNLPNNLVFKIACTPYEFEQIHKLNYQTFVEEIPQHSKNPDRKIIDKFHNENTYIICLNENNEVIGMVCVRGKRPFSLDQKINNLDDFIPKNKNMCEIRLLSVKKEHRGTKIFYGLIKKLGDYCKEMNYSIALISGTTRQIKLYKHIGFIPFADLVGSSGAKFQPMYLSLESFDKCMIRNN